MHDLDTPATTELLVNRTPSVLFHASNRDRVESLCVLTGFPPRAVGRGILGDRGGMLTRELGRLTRPKDRTNR